MQVHYDGEILTKVTAELNPGNGVPFVVIHFGKTRVFAESADDARAVIRAGLEALRLLGGGVVLGGLRELAAECYAANSDADDAMDDRGDGPDDPPKIGDGPKCFRCGATGTEVPLCESSPYGGEYWCSNRELCEQRQAANATPEE